MGAAGPSADDCSGLVMAAHRHAGCRVEAPGPGASVRIASIGRRDDIGAARPTG